VGTYRHDEPYLHPFFCLLRYYESPMVCYLTNHVVSMRWAPAAEPFLTERRGTIDSRNQVHTVIGVSP